MKPWHHKAHELIEAEAWKAYRQANYRNGKKLKRHHPYTLPTWVDDLVRTLSQDDEEAAKAIFNHQFLRDY